MSLTVEQQNAVNVISKEEVNLLKIEACAGSGKTHTLIEIAKAIDPQHGLYLAYNKAIAEEASEKFGGTSIQCSTIHSLAYKSVVRQWGLKIGWFNARDVQSTEIDYKAKKFVVEVLEDFLSSAAVSVDIYFSTAQVDEITEELVRMHLDLMADGTIDSPHSFYLKMYQVLLATNTIPAPKTDLLMLDEFGDISAITLDIFKMIDSPKKVAVGDSMQNIYSFNNTVNGFEILKGIGETVRFTESFRVSDLIASRIEGFVVKYLDSKFDFTGRVYPKDYKATTKGYIARTNSGLLEEMLRLKSDNIAFHTTRKIEMILELPLILANLGNGKKITNNKFKAVERLRTTWELIKKKKTKTAKEKAFLAQYPSPLKYVIKQMKDDEISYGADIVMRHGPFEINSLAKYVKECTSIPTGLTLTTGHSSKGLEFDVVEIAPDFNERLADAKENLMTARCEQDADAIAYAEEEFRLYYVACSRAMVRLLNAEHLPRAMIKG